MFDISLLMLYAAPGFTIKTGPHMRQSLILASASPRRKELLERIGFTVREMPSSIDESILPDEAPENYVKRVSREKVLAVVKRIRANLYPSEYQADGVSKMLPGEGMRWVVGADTIVVLNGTIFGKPSDQGEAMAMLSQLSGTEHQVITGFCLFDMVKNKEGIQAVTSTVQFKNASAEELEAYISAGESMDKAGAYAIQGVGSYLVEHLHGSYTNVVGLPLCQVVEMMQELGAEDVLPF